MQPVPWSPVRAAAAGPAVLLPAAPACIGQKTPSVPVFRMTEREVPWPGGWLQWPRPVPAQPSCAAPLLCAAGARCLAAAARRPSQREKDRSADGSSRPLGHAASAHAAASHKPPVRRQSTVSHRESHVRSCGVQAPAALRCICSAPPVPPARPPPAVAKPLRHASLHIRHTFS